VADEDIRRYSLDEIEAMVARGEDRTDWDRLKREPGIELDEEFWRNARLVMRPMERKQAVSLRLDRDVVDWFRAQGPGYQTRMNAVLRAYMEAQRRRSHAPADQG
jgi:uncharacterized protein (DUF4415 family)